MDNDRAYLSNDKDMIKFQYEEKIIRFRGPYSLERFTSVKEWDNGYLVLWRNINTTKSQKKNILI